jgi:hypothetical protein
LGRKEEGTEGGKGRGRKEKKIFKGVERNLFACSCQLFKNPMNLYYHVSFAFSAFRWVPLYVSAHIKV